jgi:hypothetical protein
MAVEISPWALRAVATSSVYALTAVLIVFYYLGVHALGGFFSLILSGGSLFSIVGLLTHPVIIFTLSFVFLALIIAVAVAVIGNVWQASRPASPWALAFVITGGVAVSAVGRLIYFVFLLFGLPFIALPYTGRLVLRVLTVIRKAYRRTAKTGAKLAASISSINFGVGIGVEIPIGRILSFIIRYIFVAAVVLIFVSFLVGLHVTTDQSDVMHTLDKRWCRWRTRVANFVGTTNRLIDLLESAIHTLNGHRHFLTSYVAALTNPAIPRICTPLPPFLCPPDPAICPPAPGTCIRVHLTCIFRDHMRFLRGRVETFMLMFLEVTDLTLWRQATALALEGAQLILEFLIWARTERILLPDCCTIASPSPTCTILDGPISPLSCTNDKILCWWQRVRELFATLVPIFLDILRGPLEILRAFIEDALNVLIGFANEVGNLVTNMNNCLIHLLDLALSGFTIVVPIPDIFGPDYTIVVPDLLTAVSCNGPENCPSAGSPSFTCDGDNAMTATCPGPNCDCIPCIVILPITVPQFLPDARHSVRTHEPPTMMDVFCARQPDMCPRSHITNHDIMPSYAAEDPECYDILMRTNATISSWEDYDAVFRCATHYAVDCMDHANLTATFSARELAALAASRDLMRAEPPGLDDSTRCGFMLRHPWVTTIAHFSPNASTVSLAAEYGRCAALYTAGQYLNDFTGLPLAAPRFLVTMDHGSPTASRFFDLMGQIFMHGGDVQSPTADTRQRRLPPPTAPTPALVTSIKPAAVRAAATPIPGRHLMALGSGPRLKPIEVALEIESLFNTYVVEQLRDDAGGVPSVKAVLSLVLVFNGTDTPIIDAVDRIIANAFAFVRRPLAVERFNVTQGAREVFDWVTDTLPDRVRDALNCTYDPITAPDEPWTYGCFFYLYHAPRHVRVVAELGGVPLAESQLPWPLDCAGPTVCSAANNFCCDEGLEPCALATYETCATAGFEDGFDNVAYALEWLFPRLFSRLRAARISLLGTAFTIFGVPQTSSVNLPAITKSALERFNVPGGLPTDRRTVFCFWWTAGLLPLYTILAVIIAAFLAAFTIGIVLSLTAVAWILLGILRWPADVALTVRTAVLNQQVASTRITQV